jgi:hypothetical protein
MLFKLPLDVTQNLRDQLHLRHTKSSVFGIRTIWVSGSPCGTELILVRGQRVNRCSLTVAHPHSHRKTIEHDVFRGLYIGHHGRMPVARIGQRLVRIETYGYGCTRGRRNLVLTLFVRVPLGHKLGITVDGYFDHINRRTIIASYHPRDRSGFSKRRHDNPFQRM